MNKNNATLKIKSSEKVYKDKRQIVIKETIEYKNKKNGNSSSVILNVQPMAPTSKYPQRMTKVCASVGFKVDAGSLNTDKYVNVLVYKCKVNGKGKNRTVTIDYSNPVLDKEIKCFPMDMAGNIGTYFKINKKSDFGTYLVTFTSMAKKKIKIKHQIDYTDNSTYQTIGMGNNLVF